MFLSPWNAPFGHYKLKDLKPHHVQELINQRHDEGITRTLSAIKITINQILEQAVANQYIYRNVAANIQMPSIPKPKKRSLTDQEKGYIIKADFDLRCKAFVYLLLFCGLRRGDGDCKHKTKKFANYFQADDSNHLSISF